MINYRKGNMFNVLVEKAPDDRVRVLVHACNAVGSWGSGVALEFKERFPFAYGRYHTYCTSGVSQRGLVGTAAVFGNDSKLESPKASFDSIGCLFTSLSYGRFVDPPKHDH